MEVNLEKNNIPLKLNKRILIEIANQVMYNYKCINGSISIIFLDQENLRKLNKKFFNKDEYTDVIAFNLEEEDYPIEGEIYISPKQVNENAKIFKEKFDTELKRVIIHGCLHLLGYEDDSKVNKQKMRSLENFFIDKFSNYTVV